MRVYWFDPGDMRTQMHQEAFPGEDISDRPLPETVVPALRALLRDAPPSGRYRAADLDGGRAGDRSRPLATDADPARASICRPSSRPASRPRRAASRVTRCA